MSSKLERLQEEIRQQLGEALLGMRADLGELTIDLAAASYVQACTQLRDAPALRFEQLMDLCVVDYQGYGDGLREGARFVVVLHLLSVSLNQRVRVRVGCADDELPVVASINPVWNAASWYEREAFDLYGVVFEGHEDLRRLLTDYGFIGHPFRKDFPVSGTVEMRYDPEARRVVYQPVSIEPREIVPRVVREAGYGDLPRERNQPGA
ncbi:MAG: NADH-quinone oxidoreductase subunit C [Betaproteobacteria bacterium]|jgi:NADH-quinone oxidoreductase subunit C|uniref:NADH-quinone oxidoreductase subunit C n=1 Tax=Thiomonas sp. FB-6 TaxID=1158291 RepID=UPI00036DADA9|nr:NADH-quinone oxidoreductase subunit C [Thiomonas sp. FB-6]MBU6439018.1 NADH-quinone oxidoreductase subunit C [Betaproteobacteria bacterium]MBU6512053.1 NADH-quinone oxidoreductase subunit C [Betaproteobacteria bacterium]MDE1954812.1 NADH-quinone oxidoreductase subunit C [Betaproteobacteria bacterium]MDE2152242.1 NADH-quinone oxidoreductase subunit C [Betaproteobacteria bacterium]